MLSWCVAARELEQQYRGDWERFGFFKLESVVKETTIRAYSMANYPEEKGIVKFNIRIATPPPGSKDIPPGIMSSWVFNLKAGDKDTDAACNELYAKLGRAGVSVLLDDTEERAGAKFATMDLIGLPFQLIVGPKGLKSGEVEVKERKSGERAAMTPDAALKRLTESVTAGRMLA